MKKMITALLSALCLCSTFQGFAQPSSTSHSVNSINWNSNYNEASKLAQTSSKPLLILFTGSTWCPACIQLEREILSRPEFAQAIGDKFVFYKAEFDATGDMTHSQNKMLFDRYGVEVFPTIVVVNSSGQKLFNVYYQSGGNVNSYVRQLTQGISQQ